MEYRSAIRTDIETGLAAHTSFFIGHHCTGFRHTSSSPGRADIHAGRLFTVLTDNGNKE
jgi:hypothetical protein